MTIDMKKLNVPSYLVLIVFGSVIITQSCTVYKHPVKAEEALNGGKVKVYLKDTRIFKFESLVSDNNEIFGVIKHKGVSTKISIPAERILYVKPEDPKASLYLTTGAVVIGGTVVSILLTSLALQDAFSDGIGMSFP